MRLRDRKDFLNVLESTYIRLWREGEMSTLPDNLANTDDLKRLWVNMMQSYPCTDTDCAIASVNLRKNRRLKLEILNGKEVACEAGLFGEEA